MLIPLWLKNNQQTTSEKELSQTFGEAIKHLKKDVLHIQVRKILTHRSFTRQITQQSTGCSGKYLFACYSHEINFSHNTYSFYGIAHYKNHVLHYIVRDAVQREGGNLNALLSGTVYLSVSTEYCVNNGQL